MKRAALLLLLIALPISAAEGVKVMCDEEVCVMKAVTLKKIALYIRALEDKLQDLRDKSGCS